MKAFSIYDNLNIIKSQYPKGDPRRYRNMILEGVASDNSKDLMGDIMEPEGFDFDHFLKFGLVNLDHLPTRAKENKSRYWVGEPIDAKVKDNKFWVKVKLWEKSEEAREFYDKACEMQESGSSRKPAFSIEGSTIEKDPMNKKRTKKAFITNLAVTFNPVNTNSFAEIKKSIENWDPNWVGFYEIEGYNVKIDKNFNIFSEKL